MSSFNWPGATDGIGGRASFNAPVSGGLDRQGLFVLDSGSYLLRRIL
ncbi:MAG: hypothetical protein NXI24_23250 [bacterium]|nr:hypothetical protein [bacterium]